VDVSLPVPPEALLVSTGHTVSSANRCPRCDGPLIPRDDAFLDLCMCPDEEPESDALTHEQKPPFTRRVSR
jgi:hypothetical protein